MRIVVELGAVKYAMMVASIALVGCSSGNNSGFVVTSPTVENKVPSRQVQPTRENITSDLNVANVAKVFQGYRNEGKDTTFELSTSIRSAKKRDIEPMVFQYLRKIGGEMVRPRYANFKLKIRETRNRTCPGRAENKTEQWSSITTQILDYTTRKKELILLAEASSCYRKDVSKIEIRKLVEKALYKMNY